MSYHMQVGLGIIPAQTVSPYFFDGTKLVAAAAGSALYSNTVALAASTWTSIISGIPGYRLYLLHVAVTVETTCQIVLRPTGKTQRYFDMNLVANTPAFFDYRPAGFNAGTFGDGVEVLVTVATNAHINILYQAVPVVG
jgi:hypothetical protein